MMSGSISGISVISVISELPEPNRRHNVVKNLKRIPHVLGQLYDQYRTTQIRVIQQKNKHLLRKKKPKTHPKTPPQPLQRLQHGLTVSNKFIKLAKKLYPHDDMIRRLVDQTKEVIRIFSQYSKSSSSLKGGKNGKSAPNTFEAFREKVQWLFNQLSVADQTKLTNKLLEEQVIQKIQHLDNHPIPQDEFLNLVDGMFHSIAQNLNQPTPLEIKYAQISLLGLKYLSSKHYNSPAIQSKLDQLDTLIETSLIGMV